MDKANNLKKELAKIIFDILAKIKRTFLLIFRFGRGFSDFPASYPQVIIKKPGFSSY
jgi:hypothetical protein